MKSLRFERLERGTYKAFLHADGFSIPVPEEIFNQLTEMLSSPPNVFLSALIEKVGYNRYLKGLLETAIQKAGDPVEISKSLQEELRKIEIRG